MRSPNASSGASSGTFGGTLRARVAWTTAGVALVVGLCAAGAAAILVDDLTLAAEDRRLLDAAELLEREIEGDGHDPGRIADDEAREIERVGLRLALFEGGVRRGGAADVPYLAREGCTSRNDAAGVTRTCVVGPASRRVIVTALGASPRTRSRAVLLAVGVSTLVAALAGALASGALAAWSLAPLTTLRRRIENVSIDAPAINDLGTPSGVAEVDALRATMRALLDRLGQALDGARTFSANAAHELRTPLATMMAELELYAERAPEGSREPLARVRRTLSRMSVLVERLLALASGAAAAEMARETVALEDVVRDVVAARDPRERARIDVDATGAGMVRGDEVLLRVIVDNLLDNALKFGRDGRVRIRVDDERAPNVDVRVEDDGRGIALDDAARLLLPFARGADSGAQGHGLGLAIVAHAARLHGGEIHFEPRETGTAVRVSLPAWRAET